VIKNLKFFFIILFLFACSDLNVLKKMYGNSDLRLEEKQQIRFNNYLNQDFYSYELNRRIEAFPLLFAITEDGKESLIIACEGYQNICNPNVKIFQILKRHEKKINKNLKILAIEKKIVWKGFANQKIKISKFFNKTDFGFYDIILDPRADDCSDQDC
jgi:hypothetical protein